MGKRTSCEKYLIGGVIVLALAVIGLLVGLIVIATNEGDQAPELCLTEGCIETANMLKKNMNFSVDPCENFYEFACGRFMAENTIPDDQTYYSSFSIIEAKMRTELKTIINSEIDDKEIKPFQDLKKFNRACLNLKEIDRVGNGEFLSKITSLGGWPVLGGEWNDQEFTWQSAMVKLKNLGFPINTIFNLQVTIDPKNFIRRVTIDQATLGLSHEYIMGQENDNFYQAYKNYQVDLIEIIGSTLSREEIINEMKETLNFEYLLANISTPRSERRDPNDLYNPIKLSDFEQNHPNIDWLHYFNSFLPSNNQITSDDTIIVGDPKFFSKLNSVLSVTPKKVVANYLMWRVLLFSAPHLSKDVRDRQVELSKALTGKETSYPRITECAYITYDYFMQALGALYVRKHFEEESREKLNKMVENVLDAFKEILREIDWMDDMTRNNALAKANTMISKMGYVDEYFDDNKINEYYNNFPISIDEGKFYQAILDIEKSWLIHEFSRLHELADRFEWSQFRTPAVVNAFYQAIDNSIIFPAGILQGAFFNADRPYYMNYGAIGFVIGHEITHGYDDQGSLYDAEGVLRNWWANETKREFQERAKCIIDQYSQFKDEQTGEFVNGFNNQGENIADNGGIKESYRAYKKWLEENGEEKRLPGIDLTQKQLFWVSNAQLWCDMQTEQDKRDQIITGRHSPSEFRVIGSVSNSQDFARDFQCPESSKMNPKNKCAVW